MVPLLFLFVRQFLNSVRRGTKNPRLLLPGILITGAVTVQITGFYLSADFGAAGAMPVFTPNDLLMGKPGAFLVVVRGVLLLSVATAVITALGEGSLFFAPSDIDLLFPAPLSRRSVLLFKMLGKYLLLMVPAGYLPLAFGSAILSGVPVSPFAFWPGILGSWVFLVAVANVTQVALLNRSSGEWGSEDDAPARRRSAGRGFIVALLGVIVAFCLFHFLYDSDIERLTEFVRRVNSETLSRRLLPDAWAADLFRIAFDRWRFADYCRLAGLLLLAALSFAWLFSKEHDFYESAMELSARRERVTAAVRSGNAGAVLSQMAREGKLARGRSLPTFGGGARAILWKDFVAATRIPLRSWLQLCIPAVFPALLGAVLGRAQALNVLVWTVLFAIQMPGLFLLTLRDMLRRADISKALPVAPTRLLLAELTLPMLQLTVLGWISLGLVMLLGLWRGPLLLVAFLVLPTLSPLLFFVQAIFAMVYSHPADPAQNMVSGTLSLLASLLALAPALFIGTTLYLLNASPLSLAASVGAANLIGAASALAVSAYLWQRFDPTD